MNSINTSKVAEDQYINCLATGAQSPIYYGIVTEARMNAEDHPIANRINSLCYSLIGSIIASGMFQVASEWKPDTDNPPGLAEYAYLSAFVGLTALGYSVSMECYETNRLKSELFVKQALEHRFATVASRMKEHAASNSDEIKDYAQDILDNRQLINNDIKKMMPTWSSYTIEDITRPIFDAAERIAPVATANGN